MSLGVIVQLKSRLTTSFVCTPISDTILTGLDLASHRNTAVEVASEMKADTDDTDEISKYIVGVYRH